MYTSTLCPPVQESKEVSGKKSSAAGWRESRIHPQTCLHVCRIRTSQAVLFKAAFGRDWVILTSEMPFRNRPCKGSKLISSNMQESLIMFPALPGPTLGQWVKGSLLCLSSVQCSNPKFKCVRIVREEEYVCWYKPLGLVWRLLRNHVVPLKVEKVSTVNTSDGWIFNPSS